MGIPLPCFALLCRQHCSATPQIPSHPPPPNHFPLIWHYLFGNCPTDGFEALSSAPTWRQRKLKRMRGIWSDLVKCWLLGSIPRCSVALLYVFVVNFQHRLIIEKLDVLRAIFGIAEARKFWNCNCSLLKHWICSLIKISHINSRYFSMQSIFPVSA